jgi:hypothetical protein
MIIALVQLFRVSVSASASSHDQPAVSSYARPLGTTLIAFGMVVLVMGESRFFFALPSHPFSSPYAHVRIYADDTT